MQFKHSFDDDNLRSIKIELDKEDSSFIKNENSDFYNNKKNDNSNSISFLNNYNFCEKKNFKNDLTQENFNENFLNNYFDEDDSNYSLVKMFSNKETICTETKSEKEISPISKKIGKINFKNQNSLNKLNIGLKYLSLKVKEIVKIKMHTTYKEVFSIIIQDLKSIDYKINEKEILNIKRRVYDALNVLISYGIITKKDKKISFNYKFEIFNLKEVDFLKNNNLKNLIKSKKKNIKNINNNKNNLKLLINKIKDMIKRNKSSKNYKFVKIPFIVVNLKNIEENEVKINKIKNKTTIKSNDEIYLNKFNVDVIKNIKINKKSKNFKIK